MKISLSILVFLVSLFVVSPTSAQDHSVINISHRCIYSTQEFNDKLYISSVSDDIKNMVKEICKAAEVEQDFEIICTNVPHITAAVDGEKKYLLYSNYSLHLLKGKDPLLYFILAHEIGHLILNHKLDGIYRIREEMKADEFAGKMMYKILKNRPELLKLIEKEKFAYSDLIEFTDREKNICDGWEIADAIIQSKSNLGFIENKLEEGNLPLPLYRPKGCPQSSNIPLDIFLDCKTLGDVDNILSDAIEHSGFPHKSYYYIEKGFAMCVPIEQINAEGEALEGDSRWQDYPAKKRFEGLLDYLSSLVVPNPGYFRVFVFVVTDRYVKPEEGNVKPGDVPDWLENGGDFLPKGVKVISFNSGYQVTAKIYEFKAPEGTKKLGEQCKNNLLTAIDHLKKSKIWEGLSIKK